MKRVLPLALCIGVMLVASTAFAQPPNLSVRFAVHAIEQPTGKTPPPVCGGTGSADPVTNGIGCSNFVTARPGGSYNWVYLVLGQGELGINGCSFGIEYSGIYEPGYLSQLNYSVCANGLLFPSGGDLDPNHPTYPANGSGMLLTWSTCQQTVVGDDGIHAVVAEWYMYAYGGGHFQITPNLTKGTLGNETPELDVNTCGQGTTKLLTYTDETLWSGLTGQVDFGGGSGRNPCLIVPTKKTSWGKIKTLFN